jgi:hypothetical protein
VAGCIADQQHFATKLGQIYEATGYQLDGCVVIDLHLSITPPLLQNMSSEQISSSSAVRTILSASKTHYLKRRTYYHLEISLEQTGCPYGSLMDITSAVCGNVSAT